MVDLTIKVNPDGSWDLPYTDNPVYSNFDHALDDAMHEELLTGSKQGQHAAWDFCGWVRFDPLSKMWTEQVWVYGSLHSTRSNEDLSELIADVNSEYGSK